MATTPLAGLLQAASVLAGQAKPSNELIKKTHGGKPELGDILAQRLSSISSDVSSILSLDSLRASDWQDLDEVSIKKWTGRYALALLQQLQLHEALEAEKRASASAVAETSKAAQQPPAPLFGVRDIKTIQILASLVARWRLAFLRDQGVLPSEMQERVPAVQVIEEDDTQRADELKTVVEACCDVLLWQSPLGLKGEIQSVILPHLLLPTLAALLQLESIDIATNASASKLLNS